MHARANAIWVRLVETPGRLRFEIRDNGVGFAPERSGERGLQNMHDRMEAIGGRLEIEAAPGRGTRVAAVVDLPRTRIAGSASRASRVNAELEAMPGARVPPCR